MVDWRDEMAKASVIEARKAQAQQDQANATAELADRVAKLEAKIDALIEALKHAQKGASKAEKGA